MGAAQARLKIKKILVVKHSDFVARTPPSEKWGVFEEEKDIIKKIEEYGIKDVSRAFRIVSGKSYSNPKRSYKYVAGILQTEAKE